MFRFLRRLLPWRKPVVRYYDPAENRRAKFPEWWQKFAGFERWMWDGTCGFEPSTACISLAGEFELPTIGDIGAGTLLGVDMFGRVMPYSPGYGNTFLGMAMAKPMRGGVTRVALRGTASFSATEADPMQMGALGKTVWIDPNDVVWDKIDDEEA